MATSPSNPNLLPLLILVHVLFRKVSDPFKTALEVDLHYTHLCEKQDMNKYHRSHLRINKLKPDRNQEPKCRTHFAFNVNRRSHENNI